MVYSVLDATLHQHYMDHLDTPVPAMRGMHAANTGMRVSLTSTLRRYDMDWVISGSLDRSLRVWDLSTGQCVQQLTGHTSFVTCVVQLQDGRVLSGSFDHSLRVWA